MVKPSSKKEVIYHWQKKYNASIQRMCILVGLARSLFYRQSVKDDTQVEEKLRGLASEFPTRGFDWYYGKVRGEGLKWNRKRVLRVYRKLNLVKRRKVKKRVNKPYTDFLLYPVVPNVTWSMDFMSDSLEDGRRIRVFNIIDDYNREALSIEVGLSFPSQRVVRVLDRLKEERGLPDQIRVDNGPEFISYVLKDYCEKNEIKLLFIPPGKPNKNGLIERFNRTYREDILDAYIFETISQVQITSDLWREKYNTGHPHQSLGGQTPVEFRLARHKTIEAYELVKAKMNADLRVVSLD